MEWYVVGLVFYFISILILDQIKLLQDRVNLLERTLKQNGIEIPTINT